MSEKDSKFSNYVENSIELSGIVPTRNEVPPKYETIVIEEPNEQQITTSSSLVEIKPSKEEKHEVPLFTVTTENGVTKLEVSCCRNLDSALNFLKYSSIVAEQKDPKHVIFIEIQIHEIFEEFKASEWNELSDKFRTNSIVIFLAPKTVVGKLAIYWKSTQLDYFLIMKPYTKIFSEVDALIYDFIAAVLVESLWNEHLGLSNNYQLSDETNRIDIFHISDSRGYNLLLLAGEAGKAKVAETLVKLGLDPVKQEGITVQGLALQNNHYDLILALYKQNVILPAPIIIDNCTGEFKNFVLLLQEFHRMVIANNVEKVKELLKQLPRTYCFLNFANESALKVATVSRAFDCYDYLLSEKLRFAPYEIPRQHYDDLQYDDQRMVREIHNKYTQELQEQHINVLIAKSFLSHDAPDSDEKLKSVHKAYQTLNANVLIKIILMIVAASKNLKVIFDFNRVSVDVADPTATSETQGLFYLSGRIYIGAKQLLNEATAHETLATIAHELCHLAMNLVYGNGANPYKKNDNKTIQEFEDISKKCQENIGKEDIIDLVYECYPTDMHHAELIVRVVHLLAFYCNLPEKLAEIRCIFGPLFDFYEKKVVSEMKEALPEIDGRAEKEIKKKDKKISKFKNISIISGIFAIFAIIGGICVGIAFYKPHYEFDKLSGTDQNKVKNAAVNYKCCQVRFEDLFNINSTAYQKLTSDHISQMLHDQPLNFSDPYVRYLDELVRHDWGNLTGKLKEEFLNSNFTFQNEDLKFQKLNEKIPKAFKVLTPKQIVDVLDGKELVVDKLIANETNFYIERMFRDDDVFPIYYQYLLKFPLIDDEIRKNISESEEEIKEFYEDFINQNVSIYEKNINEIKQNSNFELYFKYYINKYFGPLFSFESFKENFAEILNKTEESRMFILTGEAGTGKTVTFEQFTIRIKKKFPSRWVSYIDLKDHKQLYNKNEFLGNILGLLEKIFGLKSERKFEKEIFEELFKAGEVVLLWNGFDEISPTYSDFILNVLGSIHNNTQNIQFVCTRPLYTDRLRNEFNVHPYTLVQYDKNDQEEFLRKFFISVEIGEEKIQNFTKKVYKILESLSVKGVNDYDREDFNTPLMLKMVAELVTDEVEIYETENFYEIYLKFIRKKIDIWKNKSEFASKFTEFFLVDYRKFDMMRVYQKYALINENFFYLSPYLKILHEEIPEELTSDEISRMGILYINSKSEFKFAHKTFDEFFTAQFFIESIYNAKDVDPEDAELAIQFFWGITYDYGSYQVMITNFMSSFLETQKMRKNKNFDTKIAEILRTKFKNSFFDILQNSKIEFFDFLFNFFKKDHELLVDLLHVDENETFYTAAFNAAYFKFEYSDFDLNRTRLKELGKNHLTDDEYEKFIRGRNQKGIILVSLYLFYRQDVERERLRTVYHDKYDLDEEILENEDQFFVLDLIAKNLTENELKELFLSPLSPLALHAYSFVYNERFWEIVDHSLTLQEKKKFILNLFEVIFKANVYSDEISFLFDKAEEILSENEIFKLFKEGNVLHWAFSFAKDAKIEQVWNFLVNHTNEEQQKEILLRKVDVFCFGYNLIHDKYIPNMKCFDEPPLNIPQIGLIRFIDSDITKIYENIFNKTEMQEIILRTNNFLYGFIRRSDSEKVKRLANYLKNIFSGSEKLLKEFILRKIKPGSLNIFQLCEFSKSYSWFLGLFTFFLG